MEQCSQLLASEDNSGLASGLQGGLPRTCAYGRQKNCHREGKIGVHDLQANRAPKRHCRLVSGVHTAVPFPPREGTFAFGGETTEREKSMMYRTLLGQKRQSVSWTSGLTSSVTFKGNDLRHSVQVNTM